MIGRVKRKTISERDHPGKRARATPSGWEQRVSCTALGVSKGEGRDGSRGSSGGGKTSLSV